MGTTRLPDGAYSGLRFARDNPEQARLAIRLIRAEVQRGKSNGFSCDVVAGTLGVNFRTIRALWNTYSARYPVKQRKVFKLHCPLCGLALYSRKRKLEWVFDHNQEPIRCHSVCVAVAQVLNSLAGK